MKSTFNLKSNLSINHLRLFGFTIVELMIVLAVMGVLAMIAVPAYQGYTERIEAGDAVEDLVIIQFAIDDFKLTTGNLPNSLTDIGMDGMEDPWGNPYVYASHVSIPLGDRRKDHSLVPINSDYDLYSKGGDGFSSPPLTANHSQDDIVRGRDGRFIGRASDY